MTVIDHPERSGDERQTSALKGGSADEQQSPAATAGSAIDTATRNSFDLVISDLGLPDGSGHDLMRRLKAAHDLDGICLSGYGMDEDVARSLEAGFREHLTKPVNFAKLRAAVDRAAMTASGR